MNSKTKNYKIKDLLTEEDIKEIISSIEDKYLIEFINNLILFRLKEKELIKN